MLKLQAEFTDMPRFRQKLVNFLRGAIDQSAISSVSIEIWSPSRIYYQYKILLYYHPQTKLLEGNVFTRVCQSVQGGHTPLDTDPALEAEPPYCLLVEATKAGGTHATGIHYCFWIYFIR